MKACMGKPPWNDRREDTHLDVFPFIGGHRRLSSHNLFCQNPICLGCSTPAKGPGDEFFEKYMAYILISA